MQKMLVASLLSVLVSPGLTLAQLPAPNELSAVMTPPRAVSDPAVLPGNVVSERIHLPPGRNSLVGSVQSVLASTGSTLADAIGLGPPSAAMTPPRAVSDAAVLPDAAGQDSVCIPGARQTSDAFLPIFGGDGEPCGRVWASADYLLWWVKSGPVGGPLVTTGSLTDPFPGAVGQPNTRVLLGSNDHFGYDAASGARFRVGYWFDRDSSVGIEGDGLVLEQRSARHQYTSDGGGTPLLGTSFFNTALGREDLNVIAAPQLFAGALDVSSTTQLYGFETNGVSNMLHNGHWNIDAIGGFRYLGLDETLTISNASAAEPGLVSVYDNAAFSGAAITTNTDSFATHNRFYGGQGGARLIYKGDNFFVQVTGKLALGDVHEEVEAVGYSTLRMGPVGPVSTTPGGVYAGPSNGGSHSRDEFAVVPEVELKIGYQFTPHWSASVGYTFLYWSNVARPGDQIDRNVNPNRVPTFTDFNQTGGGSGPRPLFNTTDYWAQGLTFGLEFKF